VAGSRHEASVFPLRPSVRDSLYLVLFTLVAAAPYLGGLGFSSDDWSFLSDLVLSGDQSFIDLVRSLAPEGSIASRPLQALQLAVLYQAFGLRPLGYHVYNTGLFALAGVLMMLVLRELRLSRALAVAVPSLYLVLPHYSTARFWYANFHAGLSTVLYLLGLYAGLRAVRAARPVGWTVLSVVSVAASVLAYELVLPLALLHPLLLRRHASQPRPLIAWATWAAVGAVTVFKMFTTSRINPRLSLADVTGLLHQAVKINVKTYGVRAPGLVWDTLLHPPGAAAIVAAGILGLLSMFYLRSLVRSDRGALDDLRPTATLCLAGVLIAAAGYAIFLTTGISLDATGSNNRSAVIAAVGIALAAIGALAALATRLPRSARPLGFAVLVALTVFGASLLSLRLADYWVRARRQADAIVTAVTRAFPRLPPGATLILDGFCRYVGPAVVFDASWDLRGALRLRYRDPNLLADVVSPDVKVADDGIHTTVYGEESIYPYRRLLVFNFRHGIGVALPNAAEARRYFDRYDPDYSNGCPPGRPGHGVEVF
jgi:hypothetical protein